MFKRVVWTAVGYTAGVSTSIYVQRKVRRTVARYTPEHVRREVGERSRDLAGSARVVGRNLADAVREGRATMREHELELRREYGLPETTHRARRGVASGHRR